MDRNTALDEIQALLLAQSWPVPIDSISAWDTLTSNGKNEIHYYDDESEFAYVGIEVRENITVAITTTIHDPSANGSKTINECLGILLNALINSANLGGVVQDLKVSATEKTKSSDSYKIKLLLKFFIRHGEFYFN